MYTQISMSASQKLLRVIRIVLTETDRSSAHAVLGLLCRQTEPHVQVLKFLDSKKIVRNVYNRMVLHSFSFYALKSYKRKLLCVDKNKKPVPHAGLQCFVLFCFFQLEKDILKEILFIMYFYQFYIFSGSVQSVRFKTSAHSYI